MTDTQQLINVIGFVIIMLLWIGEPILKFIIRLFVSMVRPSRRY